MKGKLYTVFLSTVVCLFISGCNSNKITASKEYSFLDTREIIKDNGFDDLLEIVSSSIKNPEQLESGENLEFEVAYQLTSTDMAAIWLRPYRNGKRIGGYTAHNLEYVQKGDAGIVKGWFSFKRPTQINEVRVFMRDADTNKMIREISYKFNAQWGQPNSLQAVENKQCGRAKTPPSKHHNCKHQ